MVILSNLLPASSILSGMCSLRIQFDRFFLFVFCWSNLQSGGIGSVRYDEVRSKQSNYIYSYNSKRRFLSRRVIWFAGFHEFARPEAVYMSMGARETRPQSSDLSLPWYRFDRWTWLMGLLSLCLSLICCLRLTARIWNGVQHLDERLERINLSRLWILMARSLSTCLCLVTGTRLAKAGYAVYGMDYRGHGKSSGLKGYIPDFDALVNDCAKYYTSICGKCFLLVVSLL